mmetsp:Transcript_5677/g.16116  ORF Transcript_5677/g.16116 Transcript_5677/m.16116 type:complete len:299 (+) Transcript_5677:216-1112(+)
MSEEELLPELTDAEKREIASNFVLNSPPGQTQKVVEDVTKLVGADCLDAASLEEMVMRVNRDKFLAVEVPGAGYRVLLTPEGQLGGGLTFLDPQGRQALLISHAEQRCTGVKALDAATSAACEGAERVRASVHAAMSRYAADKLPDATVTTYGFVRGGKQQVTCCVGRCNMNLSNYWSGLWRSSWTLEVSEGAASGQLSGSVACNVHYFEDGNVQLDDGTKFTQSIEVRGDVGAAFVSAVCELEAGFLGSMEDIYTTLSESVLNALRRRLPITRVKFDWDNKASVHKLATGLNAFKMG